MHVLITSNAAWNVWNFRRPVIMAAMQRGGQVTILARRDDAVPKLEAIGCRFLELEMDPKGLNPLKDINLIRRFRRIFRQQQPDIVFSFTIKNNLYGAIAAKALAIPFIPNVTGLGTAFLSGRALRLFSTWLYRYAFTGLPCVFFENEEDRDLFVAEGMARRFQARALPGTGMALEYWGAAPYPRQGTPLIFLMVARLLRDKGAMEFVEAARQIRAHNATVRFQLLGPIDAQNRTAITAQTVAEWEAEGVVEYLGTTNDVRPVMAQAHCVVLPSYREGSPRTLMEAAAMARPVIATDVVGCRSVVDRDKSGFLCAVRDAVSLATTMERFLALSYPEQSQMGLAGRAKMEREFDEAIVIAAYDAQIQRFC